MLITDEIDLESLRKSAKLSQQDISDLLGVSQSQVSRYEQDPGDAPHRVVKKWVELCGQALSRNAVEYEPPYKDMDQQVSLIASYVEAAPAEIDNDLLPKGPSPQDFLKSVRLSARKPRLALCGRFDAGKSRLANALMGGDNLPTSYTPATRIICLIRHVNDRPDWQREAVWVMGKGFELDKSDDQDHCEEHRVIAGGFDTLKEYGTHGDKDDEGQHSAIVYIESPFLEGCDLIDLPGYGHSKNDQDKAEFAHHLADALIYASPARGFLDENDLVFLNGLLKQLPVVESEDNGLPPLANLFVVATVARMSTDDIQSILDKTSRRAHKHIEERLDERSEQSKKPITTQAFRQRFFAYLVEDPERRKALDTALAQYLSLDYPPVLKHNVTQVITSLKRSTKMFYDRWAKKLIHTLDNHEKARKDLEIIEQMEPERRQRLRDRRQRITGMIKAANDATQNYVTASIAPLFTADTIETMIGVRYKDDKKNAKKLAASYLVDHAQNKLNKTMAEHSKQLAKEIDDLLSEYDANTATSEVLKNDIEIPFDAKGAFVGSLAALGTVGGLGVWAAAAAGGSNLGGYILLSQAVGWLSSLGIGVGGTGAAASVVAAIGGPVTIAIGLSLLSGLAIFAMFGSNWKSRLAKKIHKILKEEQVLDSFETSANTFWSETLKGFNNATDSTEEAFQENIRLMRELVESTDYKHIRHLIEQMEEMQYFFGGIPWRRAT